MIKLELKLFPSEGPGQVEKVCPNSLCGVMCDVETNRYSYFIVLVDI